ncbi:MAG: hypothetical protein K8S21_11875 [Gemmatimonadetes bacterium]|nr:hypothetical protein [Gemmatimonadota bacterium]
MTGASSQRVRPGGRPLLLALVLGVTVACHIEEPFARTNLWDEKGSATKTLSGPDSTFSIGDRIRVTLVTDPPLPPGAQFEWMSIGSSDTAVQVFPSGDGEFLVTRSNAGFALVPVSAKFDQSVVVKHVWVGQLVASLDLFCGAGVPCETSPVTAGATFVVRSTMSDANGNDIRRRNEAMKRAVTIVSDPAVASAVPTLPNAAGNWTLRANAPGSTWLVVRMDRATDSVRVVVVP